MKVITIAVTVLLGFSSIVYAGEMNDTQFKAWMSGIAVDGKTFYTMEKEGATRQAMFVNPTNPSVGSRMIAMAPIKEFNDYQKTVENPKMQMGPTQGFVYQGMRTVVIDTMSEIGLMAAVEAKNINKTIVMTFPSQSSRTVIEAGLAQTGLYQK
jgi:hypothetical protein